VCCCVNTESGQAWTLHVDECGQVLRGWCLPASVASGLPSLRCSAARSCRRCERSLERGTSTAMQWPQPTVVGNGRARLRMATRLTTTRSTRVLVGRVCVCDGADVERRGASGGGSAGIARLFAKRTASWFAFEGKKKLEEGSSKQLGWRATLPGVCDGGDSKNSYHTPVQNDPAVSPPHHACETN
jgi:hypothetical protein